MRYEPFDTMDRMLEQMRRELWGLGEPADAESTDVVPWGRRFAPWTVREDLRVDVAERDGEFVVTMDLPGFEKDEIDLRFDDGSLVLDAEHESDDEDSHRHRAVHERIALTKDVIVEDVSATYRNGVLEVHLPLVAGAEHHGTAIDIE